MSEKTRKKKGKLLSFSPKRIKELKKETPHLRKRMKRSFRGKRGKAFSIVTADNRTIQSYARMT